MNEFPICPSRSKGNDDLTELIRKVSSQGRTIMLADETQKIAKRYGIPTPQGKSARNVSQALRIARDLGFPIVMKIVSQDIIHKSDIDGVKTGIESYSQIKETFKQLMKNSKRSRETVRISGVYVQKMVESSLEFFVGGFRDTQFGPMVMFGLGGIYAEFFDDVSFHLAPLTQKDALSMMNGIKAAPLLHGYRGQDSLDLISASKTVLAVSNIIRELHTIESVDVNPLFIYPKKCMAVDIKIKIVEKGDTKNENLSP